jgi:hypothetical protein
MDLSERGVPFEFLLQNCSKVRDIMLLQESLTKVNSNNSSSTKLNAVFFDQETKKNLNRFPGKNFTSYQVYNHPVIFAGVASLRNEQVVGGDAEENLFLNFQNTPLFFNPTTRALI